MSATEAHAKINLCLVVGPLREDGKHEVVTVLQRIDLSDTVGLELAAGEGIAVEGFEDTIVREALTVFSRVAAAPLAWNARIDKRIPVAAGLGGGSSDAAAALRLANELAPEPLAPQALHEVAARIGADVPFFLRHGTQLATGDGSQLEPVALPHDYAIVVVLPECARKESTAAVYGRFDERAGEHGFEERREAVRAALARVEQPVDLAYLPPNDLASSPVADELERLGAFRADVSGAGPAVYGLFEGRSGAEEAARALAGAGRAWVLGPVPG
jgi:4-diphosphocytidyl-2-C-methyl-D-erythritol kinase